MKKIKTYLPTFLLSVMFLVGLCLLLYPTVANWWNSNKAARIVSSYSEAAEQMDSEEKTAMLEAAREYNESLLNNPSRYFPSPAEHSVYESLLNTTGMENIDTVMGSISIPSIKVDLPIYHGTSTEVLAAGIGHLEGTSLPVGGTGTHCVLTGHRGLPSMELFTNLDQLKVGDIFVLTVLGDEYTYEVESIKIVLPEAMSNLEIDPDRDLCTLVTCTPYGVNTHRILVTGHRIDNIENYEADLDAKQVDTNLVALFCAIPILVILFIWLMIRYRKGGRRKEADYEDEDDDI